MSDPDEQPAQLPPTIPNSLDSDLGEVVLDVGIFGVGVREQVLRLVERAGASLGIVRRSDQAAAVGAVARGLPEHGAAEALVLHVVDLLLDGLDGVIGDELLGRAVIRVRGASRGVVRHGSRAREDLVVPDAVFPGPGAHAGVCLAETGRVLEGATVKRKSQGDLVGGDAGSEIGLDSSVRGEGGAGSG